MPYDMDADFNWFIKNQNKLVEKYNGKTLAIRNKRVPGAFSNAADAVNGVKYEMGEYLVQRCIPGEEAYSVPNDAEIRVSLFAASSNNARNLGT